MLDMMSNSRLIDSVFPGYKSAQKLPFENVDTISSKFLGDDAFGRYQIVGMEGDKRNIIIKRKNDLVILLGAMGISPDIGIFLKVWGAHRIFGFNNGQKREKLFYEKVDDSLRSALPQVLDIRTSFGGRNVVLTMAEFGAGHEIEYKDLDKIIDVITDFHAKYYGRFEAVREMDLNHYTPRDYRRARKVLRALFDYYRNDNAKLYGPKLMKTLSDFIDNIDQEYEKVMDNQTLTHNDFTSRNIAIDGSKIIIYDWELACYQNPEHDLIELLISTIDEKCTEEQIRKTISYFRKQLDDKTGRKIDDAEFAKFLRFNALEYCVNRLVIYHSYCKKNKNGAMAKYERNARKILEICA